MKIEIKNLKVIMSMSEATFCYTATIYVDGKPFCYAKNRGDGGADFYDAHEKFTGHFRSKLNELDEVCIKWGEYGFEGWIALQIDDELMRKDLKRLMKNKIVTLRDETIFATNIKYIKTHHEIIVRKLNCSQILNAMKFDDAFDIYKRYA